MIFIYILKFTLLVLILMDTMNLKWAEKQEPKTKIEQVSEATHAVSHSER